MPHVEKPVRQISDDQPQIRRVVVDALTDHIQYAIKEFHNKSDVCFTSAELILALGMATWEAGVDSGLDMAQEARPQ